MSTVESVVVRARDFDPSKITFGELKAKEKVPGAKTATVMYEGKRLMIQTDVMPTSFGVSPFNATVPNKADFAANPALRDDPNTNWSMDLVFDETNYPNLKPFREAMTKLQDVVVKYCVSKKLPGRAGKPMDARDVEGKLAMIVRPGKENATTKVTYPSSLKVKISRRDGKFMPIAFNESKEIITEELDAVVRAGSTVIAIIEVPQLFIGAQNISLAMRLSQLKVKSTRQRKGYSFIDEDEDGESSSSAPASTNDASASVTQVADSEEEEEEVEEAEEEEEDPEPEPVVIKKRSGAVKK